MSGHPLAEGTDAGLGVMSTQVWFVAPFLIPLLCGRHREEGGEGCVGSGLLAVCSKQTVSFLPWL